MGKDVFFYSITIDPKRDTPEVLKAYMEKFHVGPGWTFLTGKKEDIDLISKKIGLYSDPDPNNRDGHAPGVLIGNEPTGQWLRNGATDNPRFLTNLLENWMGNWKSASQQTKPNYADAKPLSYDRGQYMFGRHCAACHTIGHGDKIGPDLLGVTNVRDRAWLTRFISTPDAVLAQKDPIATALFEKYKQVQMPNLREADEDVKAIIDFLASQSSVQSGTPSDKNQAAIAGTGQSGK
jgi:protein SCO1/2